MLIYAGVHKLARFFFVLLFNRENPHSSFLFVGWFSLWFFFIKSIKQLGSKNSFCLLWVWLHVKIKRRKLECQKNVKNSPLKNMYSTWSTVQRVVHTELCCCPEGQCFVEMCQLTEIPSSGTKVFTKSERKISRKVTHTIKTHSKTHFTNFETKLKSVSKLFMKGRFNIINYAKNIARLLWIWVWLKNFFDWNDKIQIEYHLIKPEKSGPRYGYKHKKK